MRRLVATLGIFGALLLIAASMLMNWTFWTGQGADKQTSQVLGAVSIGIDVFKALLPLIIAWAWSSRSRLGALIGSAFFVGCLAFSFFSAMGFAASSRAAVTGGREAITLRYAAVGHELKDAKERMAPIKSGRPQTVLEEALTKAKQDRRWPSSKECTDATVEPSRQFCKEVADLRIELAGVVEAERLRDRIATLTAEIDRLVEAGARMEQDPQAGVLARISGLRIESVQTSLVVLLALLVEFGAAFGLFLALLPLRGGPLPNQSLTAARKLQPKPAMIASAAPPRPKRFVRSAGGQLMIE